MESDHSSFPQRNVPSEEVYRIHWRKSLGLRILDIERLSCRSSVSSQAYCDLAQSNLPTAASSAGPALGVRSTLIACAPERRNVALIPAIPIRLQLLDLLGHLTRQIIVFMDVF